MVRAKIVACLAEGEALVRTHEGSARALLVELIRRHVRPHARREGMMRIARVVQGELPHFPELARFYFDEVILRARRLVEQVLERGTASGEFRPSRTASPRAASPPCWSTPPRCSASSTPSTRRRSATSRRSKGSSTSTSTGCSRTPRSGPEASRMRRSLARRSSLLAAPRAGSARPAARRARRARSRSSRRSRSAGARASTRPSPGSTSGRPTRASASAGPTCCPRISGNAGYHPADAQPRRVRDPHRHRRHRSVRHLPAPAPRLADHLRRRR